MPILGGLFLAILALVIAAIVRSVRESAAGQGTVLAQPVSTEEIKKPRGLDLALDRQPPYGYARVPRTSCRLSRRLHDPASLWL
jgi:hypothetical protein